MQLRFDNPDDAAREQARHCLGRMHVFVQSKLMARVKWTSIASRKRMRRQGVEDVKGKMPLVAEPSKQPRPKLSKAELREQLSCGWPA